MTAKYYHLFANGDDARNFITSEQDFQSAFNRFGVLAAKYPKVRILSFSIEESHPHSLVYGEYEDCLLYKQSYEKSTRQYIVKTRGDLDGVVFELEMAEITDDDYLCKAAMYTIIQPTKDGKNVMPYDYFWGTGAMYFRNEGMPQIWCVDEQGGLMKPVEFCKLSFRQKHKITHSRLMIPDDWLVCNGLILPSNYLAVKQYESIFKTPNRFRVFMGTGRKNLQNVIDNMASVRGIAMQDIDARKVAGTISMEMFGKKDARWLTQTQRLELAETLRTRYGLSIRQISTLSRLPEKEIRRYIR